jgi:hypothetical protein
VLLADNIFGHKAKPPVKGGFCEILINRRFFLQYSSSAVMLVIEEQQQEQNNKE